jgi:diguanylate cyclase (GGDEF)-like protein
MLRKRLYNAELAQLNRDLAHLSTSDPLTGLANRRQLDLRLSELWTTRPLRQTTILSVILADLDHFKFINDTYGHPTGDRILTLVADALRASVRSTDHLIARFGGEEFVIILPNVPQSRAARVAERVRCEIRNTSIPAPGGGDPISLSVSCGVATAPLTAPSTGQSLIEQADLALYQAKQMGRDRVTLFSPKVPMELLPN